MQQVSLYACIYHHQYTKIFIVELDIYFHKFPNCLSIYQFSLILLFNILVMIHFAPALGKSSKSRGGNGKRTTGSLVCYLLCKQSLFSNADSFQLTFVNLRPPYCRKEGRGIRSELRFANSIEKEAMGMYTFTILPVTVQYGKVEHWWFWYFLRFGKIFYANRSERCH